MKAANLFIEVRNPEALLGRLLLGEASGEELTRRGEARELERDFGTLTSHSDRLSEVGAANDDKRVGFGANPEEMSAIAQTVT